MNKKYTDIHTTQCDSFLCACLLLSNCELQPVLNILSFRFEHSIPSWKIVFMSPNNSLHACFSPIPSFSFFNGCWIKSGSVINVCQKWWCMSTVIHLAFLKNRCHSSPLQLSSWLLLLAVCHMYHKKVNQFFNLVFCPPPPIMLIIVLVYFLFDFFRKICWGTVSKVWRMFLQLS